MEKMKTGYKFTAVAKYFSNDVTVHEYDGCCGMAGDRGFLFPELTASATKMEETEMGNQKFDGYYS